MLIKKGGSWMGKKVKRWNTASIVVLALHWLLILVFLVPRLGHVDFLRIHYTAEYGVDWIGSWYSIFTFPAFGLLAYVLNTFLAGRLATKNRLFAEVVIQSSVFLQLILIVAGAVAVLLNA